MDEEPEGSNVVLQALGEAQGLRGEPGDVLAEGVAEALHVLRDLALIVVIFVVHDGFIGRIPVGVDLSVEVAIELSIPGSAQRRSLRDYPPIKPSNCPLHRIRWRAPFFTEHVYRLRYSGIFLVHVLL